MKKTSSCKTKKVELRVRELKTKEIQIKGRNQRSLRKALLLECRLSIPVYESQFSHLIMKYRQECCNCYS